MIRDCPSPPAEYTSPLRIYIPKFWYNRFYKLYLDKEKEYNDEMKKGPQTFYSDEKNACVKTNDGNL